MSAYNNWIPLLLAVSLLGATDSRSGEEGFERTAAGVIVTPAAGPARRVRLEVMGDRIIHVTATPDANWPTQPSLMVNAQPDAGTGFMLARAGDMLTLKLPRASADVDLRTGAVQFRDAAGRLVLVESPRAPFLPQDVDGRHYYSVQQRFNPGTDESFYGLGQHQKAQMDYNGEDVQLLQHNMDIAVPFVVSSRNYGLLWDNNSITRFGNPKPYALASRDLKLTGIDGKPGLTASYYVNGKLRVRRNETDINYQFVKDLQNRPAGLQAEATSSTSAQHLDLPGETVVWEGTIEPRVTGVHRFQLYAGSYFKLHIGGKLLLDRWRQNWNAWYNDVDVPMTAGKAVAIRVDWTPADSHIALLHNDPQPAAELHSLSFASELGQAVDYYFIGGDDLDGVIAGYRRLTGKAVLLPRWAYGFWQSRQRYETQAQLLGVVAEYRKRHLPLDNIVQDWQYWRSDDWGSHRFDPARFPDPKGMVDAVHAAHANLMISVWPKFYASTDNYKELDARGFIYRRNVELGVHDWVDGVGYLNSDYDPYSAEARELYWRRVSERLGVLGIDAWWMDATEPDIHSNVDVEETKRRIGPTAMGPGAAFFNSYSLMHSGAVYDGARKDFPTRRAMILTRSGFAGLQRHAAAVWSGDTASRWDDLYNQISAGVNVSMSGLPNWTFDIGGYTMEERYKKPSAADLAEWRELNLRWFQYGAFVPLFRSHGEEIRREIHEIAPEGSGMYRSMVWYDQLRYRLLPYIYTLAADTWHRDGTILRALAMDFPADARVRNLKDEYLFGPAFLVAPVHQYQARERSVYLPAGATWYDFNGGKRLAGGQSVRAAAPLERMPVFVRAGAIVPTGPAVEYSSEQPNGPITLQVYTGADGRFDLYDDDGLSYGYEHGEFARVPIRYDEASGTLTIGARQGGFPGMAQNRVIRVRWIDGSGASPSDMDAAVDSELNYSGAEVTVRRGVAQASLSAATHSVGSTDAQGAAVQLSLHADFQDHAVLQRDVPLPIWGTAAAGRQVTVRLGEASATATADAGGRWSLQLPARPAGGPFTLTATDDAGGQLLLADVLVGDVFLCSGQSNMEMQLRRVTNLEVEIANGAHERLRLLHIPQASRDRPADALPDGSHWQVATPETVRDFSATCYFMGRELEQAQQVPIGLIDSSWGGSMIQAWMNGGTLAARPGYAPLIRLLELHARDPAAAAKGWREVMDEWWSSRKDGAAGDARWSGANADLDQWPEVALGGNWEGLGIPAFRNFDGIAWFSVDVTLDPAQATGAVRLQLGPVDDMDVTWVNGVQVGSSETWDLPRDYVVPAGVLHAGRNRVTVRVLDTGGGGGLWGKPESRRLLLANGESLQLPLRWRYRIAGDLKQIGTPPHPPWQTLVGTSTLYNGMIAPLGPLPLRGIAWYQGESNVYDPVEYASLLPAMMQDWRQRFGAGTPFFIVQLAGFGPAVDHPVDSAWAALRDVQRRVAATDAHSGLAVTIDIGDRYDIHPTNKQEVGARLARLARHRIYGEDGLDGSPQPVRARRVGTTVVVDFSATGQALHADGGSVALGFELCGKAGECRYATAEVRGREVRVDARSMPMASRVRYAWADSPVVNLVNEFGLPATPFELSIQ